MQHSATVVQQHDDSTHCSRRVWPAAHLLVEHAASSLPAGAMCLELGSGTGYAGISLAERRPDLKLLLTEMISCGAFENLSARVLEATTRSPGLELACAPYDWADEPELPLVDAILGSDLCYSEAGVVALVGALAALLRPARRPASGVPCVCFLSHTTERWGAGGFDAALLRELRAHRLRATPVAAHGTMLLDDDARIAQRPVLFSVELSCGGDGPPCADGAEPVAPLGDAAAEHVLRRAVRAEARRREKLSAAERQEEDDGQALAALLSGELT